MNPIARSNGHASFGIFENDDLRREWARRAEKREGARLNQPLSAARRSLARKWGVPYWTLTNWHRGRLKDLRGVTRDRIEGGILREIESEIQWLTHELDLLRQSGIGEGDGRNHALKTALSALRGLLDG
jgi:hypothetical protein